MESRAVGYSKFPAKKPNATPCKGLSLDRPIWAPPIWDLPVWTRYRSSQPSASIPYAGVPSAGLRGSSLASTVIPSTVVPSTSLPATWLASPGIHTAQLLSTCPRKKRLNRPTLNTQPSADRPTTRPRGNSSTATRGRRLRRRPQLWGEECNSRPMEARSPHISHVAPVNRSMRQSSTYVCRIQNPLFRCPCVYILNVPTSDAPEIWMEIRFVIWNARVTSTRSASPSFGSSTIYPQSPTPSCGWTCMRAYGACWG